MAEGTVELRVNKIAFASQRIQKALQLCKSMPLSPQVILSSAAPALAEIVKPMQLCKEPLHV